MGYLRSVIADARPARSGTNSSQRSNSAPDTGSASQFMETSGPLTSGAVTVQENRPREANAVADAGGPVARAGVDPGREESSGSMHDGIPSHIPIDSVPKNEPIELNPARSGELRQPAGENHPATDAMPAAPGSNDDTDRVVVAPVSSPDGPEIDQVGQEAILPMDEAPRFQEASSSEPESTLHLTEFFEEISSQESGQVFEPIKIQANSYHEQGDRPSNPDKRALANALNLEAFDNLSDDSRQGSAEAAQPAASKSISKPAEEILPTPETQLDPLSAKEKQDSAVTVNKSSSSAQPERAKGIEVSTNAPGRQSEAGRHEHDAALPAKVSAKAEPSSPKNSPDTRGNPPKPRLLSPEVASHGQIKENDYKESRLIQNSTDVEQLPVAKTGQDKATSKLVPREQPVARSQAKPAKAQSGAVQASSAAVQAQPAVASASALHSDSVSRDSVGRNTNVAITQPPRTPEVKIGQVDVFIEAPHRPASRGQAASRPSPSLASRHYLRRL